MADRRAGIGGSFLIELDKVWDRGSFIIAPPVNRLVV